MDLTMARRPKGNYEAYLNQVSSVIVLQDEIKNEDKNMTKFTKVQNTKEIMVNHKGIRMVKDIED